MLNRKQAESAKIYPEKQMFCFPLGMNVYNSLICDFFLIK